MEGNLIPIGAIIVKTYDGTEMAGGPFDGELSEESDNAVQNKVLAAKMAQLDQAIADVLALRAGLETFGMAKICPVGVTDVTEDNGMVLGAFEKNPANAGSIMHNVESKASLSSDNLFRGKQTFYNSANVQTIIVKSNSDGSYPGIGFNYNDKMDAYLYMKENGTLMYRLAGIDHVVNLS